MWIGVAMQAIARLKMGKIGMAAGTGRNRAADPRRMLEVAVEAADSRGMRTAVFSQLLRLQPMTLAAIPSLKTALPGRAGTWPRSRQENNQRSHKKKRSDGL